MFCGCACFSVMAQRRAFRVRRSGVAGRLEAAVIGPSLDEACPPLASISGAGSGAGPADAAGTGAAAGAFDLVVANILLGPLLALETRLAACAPPSAPLSWSAAAVSITLSIGVRCCCYCLLRCSRPDADSSILSRALSCMLLVTRLSPLLPAALVRRTRPPHSSAALGCCRFVKPGGRIALSGILGSQAPQVVAAYAAHFDALQVTEEGGWALVEGVRRR